jgi:hypothetical protein
LPITNLPTSGNRRVNRLNWRGLESSIVVVVQAFLMRKYVDSGNEQWCKLL